MKLYRQPLLHFLLLGAAIFAAFSFINRHRTDKPGEIVVTRGTLENLFTAFTRTWQRPPTEGEMHGLVRDYVREEVAYRQALTLGLDRDDMIVRRRLQQKLEFLSDDLATRTEPSDAELLAFLQTHSSLFRIEPAFSFRQVYFNPQRHGANLLRDESRVLTHLQRSGEHTDITSLGDPFLLQQNFENASLQDVKKTFGDGFTASLSTLPMGHWQGPVGSGYGVHLVFISQRSEGGVPALSEIREQVRREWLNQKRKEATDAFYANLLKRYTIKIEPPEEQKVAQVH